MSRYGYGKRAKADPSYLTSLLQRTINRVGSLVADMDYVAERLDEGDKSDKQVLISLDAATGSMEASRLLLIETVRRIAHQTQTGERSASRPDIRPSRLRVEPIRQSSPEKVRHPYTRPHPVVNPLHGDKP